MDGSIAWHGMLIGHRSMDTSLPRRSAPGRPGVGPVQLGAVAGDASATAAEGPRERLDLVSAWVGAWAAFSWPKFCERLSASMSILELQKSWWNFSGVLELQTWCRSVRSTRSVFLGIASQGPSYKIYCSVASARWGWGWGDCHRWCLPNARTSTKQRVWTSKRLGMQELGLEKATEIWDERELQMWSFWPCNRCAVHLAEVLGLSAAAALLHEWNNLDKAGRNGQRPPVIFWSSTNHLTFKDLRNHLNFL